MMRGPVWGVRRRLVSVIPSRSARKDCPTHGWVLGQPSRYEKTLALEWQLVCVICVSSYKGQKGSTPLYSKAVLLFKGVFFDKCSKCKSHSFVRRVCPLPAPHTPLPAVMISHWPPACLQPLAPNAVAGASAICLALPQCTRMRSQPGVSRGQGEPREVASHAAVIISCAASLPDHTSDRTSTHPLPLPARSSNKQDSWK